MWACVARRRRTRGRRRPRAPRLCGQSWGPLCQPLNDDSVEQVGFLQGLVLISQLFIGEGGHEDETGGSHRWPSIYYEEPDVTDPVTVVELLDQAPTVSEPDLDVGDGL